MKKLNLALAACSLACLSIATDAKAAQVVSEPTEVKVSSSGVYWSILTTSTPRLCCEWPRGATAAELCITGKGVNHVREFNRSENETVLEIDSPAIVLPEKFADETLYSFVLSFDNGKTFSASLAAK